MINCSAFLLVCLNDSIVWYIFDLLTQLLFCVGCPTPPPFHVYDETLVMFRFLSMAMAGSLVRTGRPSLSQ